IQADCRTDHLRLVHDQQAYSLTMPLHFELEAVHGDQSEVRTLHLRMPFFELKGDSGNEGFVLNGEGDLERMSQELGRLFAMDYQARGHVQVSATSRHDGEERHRLDSRLTVNNFSLLKDDQVVLPAHPLSITAAATAAGLRFDLNSVDDLSLEASIWPGTLSFHVRNMRQCTGPGHDNFSMQTRFDAGRLRNTVQGFFLEKYLAGTEGGVRFEAAGTWCDNVITLQKLRGEIADLTVAGEKAIIREPRVVFGLGGLTAEKAAQQVRLQNLLVVEDWAGFVHKTDPLFQLNIDKRSIEICRFTLSSARAAVELNAGLRDWKQVEAGYSLAVQGEGEDSLVGDVLRVAGLQAPDMNVQGKVRGNWSYRGGGGQGSEQAVFFAVSSLKVTRSRRVLASDPFVTCSLRLEEADEQPFELKMTDFDLRASLMHIAGTGRIIRNEQPNLNLQGQFTPRYVQLKPLLLPYIGPDISLSGTRSGTFQLSLPLTMPVRQEDITVTAELPLDSLRFRDIDLGAVELPLDFHRNQLRVRIDGQLDAGKVSLAPLWDLSASQPTLTLPAKAPCLAGVSPQPPLLDGVLGRLHPLFGVFAQLRGTMDLYINHFSVPITGRGWGSPVFDISLAVDQLRFTPMGPLQELLSLNGYVQEWYPCAEKEIRCQGKAGKVQCAPVHLVADDERVALQGEFGRQQELQYTVRFPLGQALAELIGSDGNEEERSVSAVVTGTRQKPECDIHALVAGLAHELIKSRKAGRYGKQPQADEPVEP
ncbi:MAG: hypothetical protein GXY53_02605, partial [Desulfobulbus sp.]|nr:hypothetical protein [Desulfobulbus sp.]